MKIIIFEYIKNGFLKPFSLNHSPFEIRIGVKTNLERIREIYPESDIILIVDESKEEVIREKFPNYTINPDNIPAGLCLNGAAIFKDEHKNILESSKSLSNNKELISFKLSTQESFQNFKKQIEDNILVTNASDINVIVNIWDIFKFSEELIKHDFQNLILNNNYSYNSSMVRINGEYIHIGLNSKIKAGVIIDASDGPVIIDDNVVVDHGTVIEGPCYIGKNTYISPNTLIRKNNTIGPMCKLGGEITCCNILGFSNKVHDGFLGHSFIGEWVNIGAGTNNSNLKNNYSNVKVKFKDKVYDSELQFLGCLIGDFTRISIGTNINTGSYIGLAVNLFNHNFLNNYVPSFSWGDNELVKIDSLLNTIQKMKARRTLKLSDIEKKMITDLYKKVTN